MANPYANYLKYLNDSKTRKKWDNKGSFLYGHYQNLLKKSRNAFSSLGIADQEYQTAVYKGTTESKVNQPEGFYAPGQGKPIMPQTVQMTQQMRNLAAQYPSYPNEHGLGSQSPGAPAMSEVAGAPNDTLMTPQPTPGAESAPGFSTQPVANSNTDSSSRGFNPWSMMGEANSR